MSRVQATAPGKIILFGEHAVVYGRPAMAIPVTEVQARATLQPAAPGADFRLVASNLGRDEWLTQAAAADPLATTVRLALQHLQAEAPAATLHVSSTIPLGRGLGSGAAVSTAIVRALAQFVGRALPPAEVSDLVYEVEKLYHGTPSGIDNTVIAFNQPVYFVRGQPIRRMAVAAPFTLVIADTGIVSPTHKAVGYVRERRDVNPARYDHYFDQIQVLVDQARLIIEQDSTELTTLGQLMNENQKILETIGVSSSALTNLVDAARRAGAWGAKLSGAGWGGNMIALTSPRQAPVVKQAVTAAGATGVIITEVKQGGVTESANQFGSE